MGFRNCLVLVLALALMTGFAAGPAAAGKKDGTLNIALEKELETLCDVVWAAIRTVTES